MKNFRRLKIWQRGMELVKKVYAISKQLPEVEKFNLVSQMNRSVVSIPSNIAEGCSCNSDLELNRFVEISLGSAFELETQLLIAKELYVIAEIDQVLELLEQEQKMLNAYRTKLKSNPNANY